jgi:calcineurin-like phosphoesterase family protein
MNIWFASDFHFNHFNIIKYTGRPFKTLDEMNDTIIRKFNERVKEDDLCFFMGDFIFKSGSGKGEGESDKAIEFRDKLLCKSIIFLEGNHDKGGKNSLKTPIRKIIIRYGGRDICLVHDPTHLDFSYSFCICGHVHEKWHFKEFTRNGKTVHCCNVSVEQTNYYPVSWNEIDRDYSVWLREKNHATKT